MYVKSIRRWIEVEEGGGGNGIIQLEPIPGAGGVGIRDDDDDGIPSGWVDPTSTSDLWWPRDLDSLQVRPALNVLFRSGVLSYVSAGLDVRVPTRRRNDGCRGGGDVREDDGDGIAAVVAAPPPSSSSWRNHGLNSQPIARQWTTPGIAYERMFHVEGFVLPLPRKGGEGGEGGGRGRRRRRTKEETREDAIPEPERARRNGEGRDVRGRDGRHVAACRGVSHRVLPHDEGVDRSAEEFDE